MNEQSKFGINWLLIMMLVGIVAGIFCGWYFGPAMVHVEFLGTIFMNALKAVMIPLIVSSITVGITRLGDFRGLGRMGGLTIGYYLISTTLAVVLGLILCNVIEPGTGVELGSQGKPQELDDPQFNYVEMITPNIFADLVDLDVLPIIIAVIVFACALSTLGKRAEPMVQMFEIFEEVMMKIVNLIMLYAPIGVFALIASILGEKGGGEATLNELQRIGWYVITVITGLGIHGLITLPVLLIVFGKRNPLIYLKNMLTAVVTAFSTASSAATLPLTMHCVEKRNNVSPETTSFVLPIGATVNMDGTALYEAVAAVFIAQAYGVELTMAQQIIVVLTATLASIGAAAIPHAGLVTMMIVLQAVDLPVEGIGLIFAVDWLLDRFRTAVNIWGDSIGAGVVETMYGRVEKLEEILTPDSQSN